MKVSCAAKIDNYNNVFLIQILLLVIVSVCFPGQLVAGI